MAHRGPIEKSFGIGQPPANVPRATSGRLIGRIIIEAFEPDAKGDGLQYSVDLAGPPDAAAVDRFVRATVERLRVRLDRQRPIT